jgi:hypothetical protein
MIKSNRLLFLLLLLGCSVITQAQDANEKTGFGSTMRSSGRIYVVIAVILTILAGLFLYLVRLDRKIGKLEKQS